MQDDHASKEDAKQKQPGVVHTQSRRLREKDLLKKLSFYSIGEILTKGSSAVLIPLYSYFLTPAEYGDLSLVLLFSSWATIFLGFSMGNAIFRNYGRVEPATFRVLLSTITLFLIAFGTTLISGVVAFQAILATLFLELDFLTRVLPALLSGFFLGVFEQLASALLRIKGEARAYATMTSIGALIKVAFIVFTLIFQANVTAVVMSIAVSSATMALYYCAVILKELGGVFRFSKNLLLEALVLCVPLIPHSVSHILLNMADRYLLKGQVSISEVGIYTFGFNTAWILAIAYHAVNNAFTSEYSRLTKGQQELDRSDLIRVVRLHLLVTLGIFLIAYFFLPPLLQTITGEMYLKSFEVIPLILLSAFFYGLYFPFINLLTIVQGRTSFVPLFTTISAVINIALNIFLIPIFGIMAAAVSSVVGYFLLFLQISIFSSRRNKLNFGKSFSLCFGLVLLTSILADTFLDFLPAPLGIVSKGVWMACIGAIFLYRQKEKKRLEV